MVLDRYYHSIFGTPRQRTNRTQLTQGHNKLSAILPTQVPQNSGGRSNDWLDKACQYHNTLYRTWTMPMCAPTKRRSCKAWVAHIASSTRTCAIPQLRYIWREAVVKRQRALQNTTPSLIGFIAVSIPARKIGPGKTIVFSGRARAIELCRYPWYSYGQWST